MVKEIAKNMEDPMTRHRDATRNQSIQTEFERLMKHTHHDQVERQIEEKRQYGVDDTMLYKLEKLADLKQEGVPTEQEFQKLKAELLE